MKPQYSCRHSKIRGPQEKLTANCSQITGKGWNATNLLGHPGNADWGLGLATELSVPYRPAKDRGRLSSLPSRRGRPWEPLTEIRGPLN